MFARARCLIFIFAGLLVILSRGVSFSEEEKACPIVYPVGEMKPVDSATNLKVGDRAPDFMLPSLTGEKISLNDTEKITVALRPGHDSAVSLTDVLIRPLENGTGGLLHTQQLVDFYPVGTGNDLSNGDACLHVRIFLLELLVMADIYCRSGRFAAVAEHIRNERTVKLADMGIGRDDFPNRGE